MAKKEPAISGNVARNRKALRDYFIEDRFEAGIVLTGTEVKSLRAGRATINEAFAREKDGEIWLEGCHIPQYDPAGRDNHEPNRSRKLLLHHREIARLTGATNRSGYTLVPLNLYFNSRGVAKLELGLGKGKHSYDKRAAVRDRDWKRQKERLMRNRG
jgi:SsrA-binding protein